MMPTIQCMKLIAAGTEREDSGHGGRHANHGRSILSLRQGNPQSASFASRPLPDEAPASTREESGAPPRISDVGLPVIDRIRGHPYANWRELARM